MDTTDTSITFDTGGVCDHCRTFDAHTLPNWPKGAQAETLLRDSVDAIKDAGRGADFDCIIGMSGGIDSSYLTYLAKEKLGLRPLIFHVDAGWNTDVAVNNIEALVDGLDLELFTEVIDWQEMKDLQLAFIKSGVPHIDTPQDHAFFATMYKFALEHKVKYILTGGNLSTECVRNPIDWMYYQSDSTQLLDIHKSFGQRRLEKFPVTSILWHKVFLPYIKRIKTLRPLDLMDYQKEEAATFLKNAFGWQPYPQKHFESRFTRFYEGYWLPKKFGFDTRKVQLSSLILTDQITRAEAIEILKQSPYSESDARNDFEFVANKLQISVDELRFYFEQPNRTYKHYKNQAWLYNFGARILKGLGREVGGKR